MALDIGSKDVTVGARFEKVERIRFHLPARMKPMSDLLIEGIKGYRILGAYGSFGVLLKGIPGTGKSHFARYVSEQAGAPYCAVPMLCSAGEVTELFEQGRALVKKNDGAAILVFDDLDYVGKRSEGSNPAFRPILAELLKQMENPEKNIGIFTFITSNLPDMLDEALRRPPRVTYEFEFFPPNAQERKEILKAILSDNAVQLKWDEKIIDFTGNVTFGYTPGDLIGIVQNATMQAIVRAIDEKKKGKTDIPAEVTTQDVLLAKKMQKPSAIRDMPFIEPSETLNDLVGGYVLNQKSMLAALGERIDNGILAILYGPSGSGKTALAKAVAGTSGGWNCLYFNPSHIVDKYVGESGKALARAFSRAKALGPCVLILDQAEGILNPSNPYAKEWTSVLKSELSEPLPNVFVIMTATDPSPWGEEILSRFHKIYVPAADERSIREIFCKYLPPESIGNVDVDEVLKAGNGKLSPRDVRTTIKNIQDFGGTVNTQTLIAVVNATPFKDQDIAYDRLSEQIGDASRIFAAIKKPR